MKTCTSCTETKEATTEFFVKKGSGLSARCKPCLQIVKRAAWARDADTINAARRANRSEFDRERDRRRHAESPKRREYQNRLRRRANPERAKEKDAASYRRNADKKKQSARAWAERNPERKAENLRNWHRQQRMVSSRYRLKCAISAYLWWCLKGAKRGAKTEDVLGYTMDKLRRHLERQFAKGMTWENYGEWHVDHIVPLASFEFSSVEDAQFRACWALTNLRPLWAPDNILKSNSRTHLI